MTDEYGWLIGSRATYEPTGDASPSSPGKIIEVRDDHPDSSAKSIRVVITFEDKVVDVQKDRVRLE